MLPALNLLQGEAYFITIRLLVFFFFFLLSTTIVNITTTTIWYRFPFLSSASASHFPFFSFLCLWSLRDAEVRLRGVPLRCLSVLLLLSQQKESRMWGHHLCSRSCFVSVLVSAPPLPAIILHDCGWCFYHFFCVCFTDDMTPHQRRRVWFDYRADAAFASASVKSNLARTKANTTAHTYNRNTGIKEKKIYSTLCCEAEVFKNQPDIILSPFLNLFSVFFFSFCAPLPCPWHSGAVVVSLEFFSSF